MMKSLILLFAALFFASATAFANLPETGMATYYAAKFHNRMTASGERYHKDSFTAAHPSLPFGTYVKVTNLANNRSVIVRINDRGPLKKGRVIDLSTAAAVKLDMISSGVVKVKVEMASGSAKSQPEPENEQGDNQVTKNKPNNTPATTDRSTASTQKGGFLLQTGAFKIYDNAMKSKADLSGKGITNLSIKTDNSPSGSVYKVVLGPYMSREEAEEAKKKLQEQSVSAFVIKQ